jgi:hypothetical protein
VLIYRAEKLIKRLIKIYDGIWRFQMLIREIQPVDAENFICLIKQVESEAKFMLMEAGERKTTPEQ